MVRRIMHILLSGSVTERLNRDEAKLQVNRFSAGIYKGYRSEAAARASFNFAAREGLLRGDNLQAPESGPPNPYVNTAADAQNRARILDPEGRESSRWYIVTAGIRPGIYSTMCVHLTNFRTGFLLNKFNPPV